MKTKLLFLTILLFASSVFAVDFQINALVTFTNTAGTTNGMQVNVNGNIRTFTNNVVTPASQIATNNTIGGSATNYFSHVANYPYAGVDNAQMVDHTGTAVTNAVKLIGRKNQAMSVSCDAVLGVVTFVTNTVSTMYTVRVPGSTESSAQRTNIYSMLVTALNDYSTNLINQNLTIASGLVGTTNAQTISIGQKFFTGPNIHSNSAQQWIGGTNSFTLDRMTNGYWTNGIAHTLTMTNGINYGNAFRSPGIGLNSEQYGNGATASGSHAIAIGRDTVASGAHTIALGNTAAAEGDESIAIGRLSIASGDNSIAIGDGSVASATRATALGNSTTAEHVNSTALGYLATTTADNQVMLGSPGVSVRVNNVLEVGTGATNLTLIGTNVVTAGLSYTRMNNTSLANGNNAAVDIGGTEGDSRTYVRASGPSAAFTINGIAGGWDGRLLILHNHSGQTMVIANNSGTDPVAANRIFTGTGGDITNTNSPGIVSFIYDDAQARWIVVSRN